MAGLHDFTMRTISGGEQPLADYRGQVAVVVNVASRCGLTPQYADLELFYREAKAKGVTVLGFPANNFGAQEPGSDAEIQAFCSTNYEVSFPMFSKISVKGADQHPLYSYLTTAAKADVQWNFQKFLVGKDGQVLHSFAPTMSVNDPEFRQAVDQALKA